MKTLAFIVLSVSLWYLCDGGSLSLEQQQEQNLTNTLLAGYNTNIRPDNQVSVLITAMLQQIITIDERQQVMTSSSFIAQSWYDDRLSWSENSTNITVLMLPVKRLWIPDTMILNSADANGYLTVSDYSLASVDSSGQVYMILPALTARTRCSFNVQKFPFDRQVCSINLTSWSQGANRILYIENDSLVIDTSEYVEHALWGLERIAMDVSDSIDRVPFEDTYSSVISIQLYLRRKPLFFLMNGIFACWILNCVTLLAFALPFAIQITLSMTCFLTYSVYSLNFSNIFPQQSEYLMMITLYFLLSVFWTLLSMIWFIIYTYYTTKSEIPKALYAFHEQLQKFSGDCSSKSKKKNVIVATGSSNIATVMQPIDTLQPKCHSCDRCGSCQTTLDQNQIKDKKKKDVESKWNTLHYLVFFCVFLLVFISDLALWIIMST